MARNSKVPSETTVPQQVRFPHEADSNMDIMSTSRPTYAASSNFPGKFPIPAPRTYEEMNEAGGEFMYRSHSNGKK